VRKTCLEYKHHHLIARGHQMGKKKKQEREAGTHRHAQFFEGGEFLLLPMDFRLQIFQPLNMDLHQ
jgi:hypothetical protein